MATPCGGGSDDGLDGHVLRFLQEHPPTRALDIGPGRGKYGRLVRQTAPECRLDAIEATSEYVDLFALRDLYSSVQIGTAKEVLWRDHHASWWDVVFLGDVLEHMPKSEGVDVLHFLFYRARTLVVQWPHQWHQSNADGPFESHVSHWNEGDFTALTHQVTIVPLRSVRLAIVNGMVGHPETVGEPYAP